MRNRHAVFQLIYETKLLRDTSVDSCQSECKIKLVMTCSHGNLQTFEMNMEVSVDVYFIRFSS